MDRSKVRIGLLSVGIIAGLIFILYLPVLIWSPPWGDNGYYKVYDDEWGRFQKFENGHYQYIITFHNDLDPIETIVFNRAVDYWENTKYNMTIKFEDGTMLLTGTKYSMGRDDVTQTFYRDSNPFNHWHIKWLEWTSD